jgi:hypothetical protein
MKKSIWHTLIDRENVWRFRYNAETKLLIFEETDSNGVWELTETCHPLSFDEALTKVTQIESELDWTKVHKKSIERERIKRAKGKHLEVAIESLDTGLPNKMSKSIWHTLIDRENVWRFRYNAETKLFIFEETDYKEVWKVTEVHYPLSFNEALLKAAQIESEIDWTAVHIKSMERECADRTTEERLGYTKECNIAAPVEDLPTPELPDVDCLPDYLEEEVRDTSAKSSASTSNKQYCDEPIAPIKLLANGTKLQVGQRIINLSAVLVINLWDNDNSENPVTFHFSLEDLEEQYQDEMFISGSSNKGYISYTGKTAKAIRHLLGAKM